MTLLDQVKAKQMDVEMSDSEFAAYLGISRSLWSVSKSRKRLGPTVTKAVAKRFPSLRQQAYAMLLDEAHVLEEPEAVAAG